MATRKIPPKPQRVEAPTDSTEPVIKSEPAVAEAVSVETKKAPGEPASHLESTEHKPRFQFFIIDAGWKSPAAKVLRDNFAMIREFQNNDPLYILSREQSIALIRKNKHLIGKDPILLVHDLHAKGGRGLSGYHGFRLNLGLIRDDAMVLNGLQTFLRFIANHRHSANIEDDIRQRLHREGLEGAIDVIREGAKELME